MNLVNKEIILSISNSTNQVGSNVLLTSDITPQEFLIKLVNVSGISASLKCFRGSVNAIAH